MENIQEIEGRDGLQRQGVASGWWLARAAIRRFVGGIRGRGQARGVLVICCGVYSYRQRGWVSDESRRARKKKAHEGSFSVIRCGERETVQVQAHDGFSRPSGLEGV